MKLYYNPKSRAVVAKWMLDECGADYEILPVDFEKREHKKPEFLKINPAGKLPSLVWGGSPDRPKLEVYLDRLLQRPAAMKVGG